MKRYFTILLLFAASLRTDLAAAAPSGTDCKLQLSLDEVRALAIKNSPAVSEIDAEYAAELARAFNSSVLNNPELQADYVMTSAYIGGANDPQSSVSLSQPLRLSDFGKRRKVAELITKAGSNQQRAKLLELNQQLIIKYAALYQLQQAAELYRGAERLAADKVVLIRRGVTKGLMTLGDESLFEGERYRVQAQLKGVEATISSLQFELGKLTGLSRCPVVAAELKFAALPPAEELINIMRRSEISDVSRIEALNSLATEQLRLTELDAFPKITPRAVYQHTNDGGDFWGVGITVPLPVWDRNQGEISKAEAERLSVARRRELLSNGGIEQQIRQLRESTAAFEEQSALYAERSVPAFEAALKSRERLYSEGKGDIIQVWQTFRTLNEVKAESIKLWMEGVEARARLSILVGEEL